MKYLRLFFGLFSIAALVFLIVMVFSNEKISVDRKGPSVIMEVYDPSLYKFEAAWRDEIDRRFDHAVGILVHGGDFVSGQWIVGASSQPWMHVTEVSKLVEEVKAKYPDRIVVLLACNPGHVHLNIPGVYYALDSVWCLPDRAITPEMFVGSWEPGEISRWQSDPNVVGNIYEFVTD